MAGRPGGDGVPADDEQIAMVQRVSPPRIFPTATRAGKPPISAAGSADSYRQIGFVLGDEVEHVIAGLNFEGACAEASSGAKYRKQVVAASLGLWSRGWLARLQALHAIEWGNAAAAMPLVRAAVDMQAAMALTLQTGAREWEEWLGGAPIGLAEDDHATAFAPHAFRAAEVLAADDVLGGIYRAAMALSLPHFESTLLLTGADSTAERVLMTFGDRDFHLGLAELVLGWLLALGMRQVETLRASSGVVAVANEEQAEAWCSGTRSLLSRGDRCVVDPAERDGMPRLLVRNWRRAPGAAKKNVLM